MFTTDSRTEKFLDWIGVKWHYTNEMSFDRLSPNWDSQNLGRSQVRVQAAVQEYGALMDRGSAAPAPILWFNDESDYNEVLDGIQRLLAEEARKSVSFSAYVVESDSPIMVKKIRVFANYRLQGGFGESSEWTLEKAIIELINSDSMSIEEVAEFGGWPPATVRDKKQSIDFGNLVRDVGGPDKLPDSMLRSVGKHSAREDFSSAPVPIAGFLNDVKRMRLSAAEAEPYLETFFSVSRSKGKLFDQFNRKLTEFRDDDEVAGRLADPSRRRYQPMSSEGKLLKVLKGALTTASNVLDSGDIVCDMAEYFQTVGKIKKVLSQIERISKNKKR